MILVTLGTQDKSFDRLLKAIDREIKKGNIKDKVVVQAGYTKYKSKNMEIFDLIAPDKFDELMKEANLVITHGGAGSILTAIKKGKTVIAAPRLSKYKEHTNDHQKELIEEFANNGYIIPLYDFNKLDKVLEKAEKFKPKKFESNTNNMINLISNYIKEDNHTSWWNKYKFIIQYFLFFIIYVSVYRYLQGSILIKEAEVDYQLNLYKVILVVLVLISFISSKYIVFKDKKRGILNFIAKFIAYGVVTFLAFMISVSISNNVYLNESIFFIITLVIYKIVIFNDNSKWISKLLKK